MPTMSTIEKYHSCSASFHAVRTRLFLNSLMFFLSIQTPLFDKAYLSVSDLNISDILEGASYLELCPFGLLVGIKA